MGIATPSAVKLLAAAALLASLTLTASAAALVADSSPAARCSRRRACGTSRSNKLPVAANSATLIRSIGARRRRARRLRQRPLRRLAHRHPVRRRARQDDAEVARDVRLRRRERQGPVSDPGERADRGRAGARERGRPPRAHRRPRHVQAVRALRAAAQRLAAGRAGSGAIFNLRSNALRPAGWTSADAAGLPILPGPRALGRRRVDRRDRSRAALHRRADAEARTSIRRATTRATRTIRRCRRWGCACG